MVGEMWWPHGYKIGTRRFKKRLWCKFPAYTLPIPSNTNIEPMVWIYSKYRKWRHLSFFKRKQSMLRCRLRHHWSFYASMQAKLRKGQTSWSLPSCSSVVDSKVQSSTSDAGTLTTLHRTNPVTLYYTSHWDRLSYIGRRALHRWSLKTKKKHKYWTPAPLKSSHHFAKCHNGHELFCSPGPKSTLISWTLQ